MCCATDSGVGTGWHGWTMSRGPGAKGATEKEREKKMKNRKENQKEKEEKKKREHNFSNTQTGALTQPIYSHESK